MPPHLSLHATAGALVFISGQLAFQENGNIHGNIAEQTARTLANLERVLADSQLGLGDVVKTTVWLRNASDFTAFNAAYAQAFGDHRPARSTVVAELVIADALVEIEAIALRRTAE